MALEIDVLTLFPAMISGPLAASIPGRIQERGIATVRTHDLRQWGLGRHRSVDDAPYGGGAGMVMRAEPIVAAHRVGPPRRLDRDPARPGRRGLRPGRAPHDLAAATHLVFVCPRYEGVDERVRSLVDLELSIGDYVLTGGELPALVVIDAVIRLLPGRDRRRCRRPRSRSRDGLLEYPQYTRPAGVPRARTCRRSSPRATTARSPAGGASRRSSGRRARRPDLLADRTGGVTGAAGRAVRGGTHPALTASGRTRSPCYTPPPADRSGRPRRPPQPRLPRTQTRNAP